MEALIEHLSSGPVIAFVGAGVSAEIGIPAWRQLSERLVADLASEEPRRDEALRLIESERYAELMDLLVDVWGSAATYDRCRKILEDTGRTGDVASFIASFGFLSVFTTNVDDVLARHFDAAGIAVRQVGNGPTEIRAIDVDRARYVVKLHSDFQRPGSLIFTGSQYRSARFEPEFEYLRKFISAHLIAHGVLFIGYSLKDPDIALLLEQCKAGLTKEQPLFALMANVLPEDRDHYFNTYNVRVIQYGSRTGDHRELVAIVRLLGALVVRGRSGRRPVRDLRRSQSLYLWSRFGLSAESSTTQVDSLKSVVISHLSAGPFSMTDLQAVVAQGTGLSPDVLGQVLPGAIQQLERDDLVTSGSVLRLSAAGEALAGESERQHEMVRTNFVNQVRLDVRQIFDRFDDREREAVEVAVEAALVEVFDERGVELVNAAFAQATRRNAASVNLFAALRRVGSSLPDPDLVYRFIGYVVKVLTEPSDAHRAYLDHLAFAFFSLHALSMDPEGQRFREQFLRETAYLVDSNVLIPLLALEGRHYRRLRAVLSAMRSHDIQLVTSGAYVDEVLRHARWAWSVINEFGPQSIEFYETSRGTDERRWNALLDGFVEWAGSRNVGFDDYLSACLGGRAQTRDGLIAFLHDEYGIDCVEFESVAAVKPEVFDERDAMEEFIEQEAESYGERPAARMRAEAETYALLVNWDLVRPLVAELAPCISVRILARGGFFNRLALRAPIKLDTKVAVLPEVMFSFLLQVGVHPEAPSSVRELMMSPLFSSSEHFLDLRRYEDFFAELIHDAEDVYAKNEATFRDRLGDALTADRFAAVKPLERPRVLARAQSQLKAQLALAEIQRAEAERTAEEMRARALLAEARAKRAEKPVRGALAAQERKARKAEKRGRRRPRG